MPQAGYYEVTVADAAVTLSGKLQDPAFVHWSRLELEGCIVEAYLTWSALTASFRETGIVHLQPDTVFYDLTAELPNMLGARLQDTHLVRAIEYALLEPPTPDTWTGSPQFNLHDIVQAIQDRRDQFLQETGIILTRQVLNTSSPPTDGRIQLPETVISLQRLAWVDREGDVAPLIRGDEWGLQKYQPNWPQNPTRPPKTYAVGATPPLLVQIAPAPSDSGLLDLVGVSRGPTLNPAAGVALGVPDDWAWVIKYGALADLLSHDFLALDEARAAYCEQRWQQGITLASMMAGPLACRMPNYPLQIRSLSGADRYKRGWQSQAPGPPKVAILAGPRLFAVPPVDRPYDLSIELVVNAPLFPQPPTKEQGFGPCYLELGPEVLDTVIGYAQHVAMFKDGLGDLQASQSLLDDFMAAAGVKVKLDTAMVPHRAALHDQANTEQRMTPRVLPVDVAPVVGVGDR